MSSEEKKKDFPRVKNTPTRFGVWGSLTAQYVSVFYLAVGFTLFLWKILASIAGRPGTVPYVGDPPELYEWGASHVLLGLYCICVGGGVWYYEQNYGYPRGIYNKAMQVTEENGKYTGYNANPTPSILRGFCYIALSLPGYMTLPSLLGGVLFILPISLNFVSAYHNEIYEPPRKRAKRAPSGPKDPITKRAWEFVAGINPEGQFGRVFVLTTYVFVNFWYGIKAVREANEANVQDTFTYWVHMAKFFGYIMDINFSYILIPVSRSLLRSIYNYGTKEEDYSGCLQTFGVCFFKVFVKLVPVDQAHGFHKLLAFVGFWSAVMHTIAHLMNFGLVATVVMDKFGIPIFITGVGLITIMLFLFSCAHAIIKRNHFELFWGTHMLFPLFLFLCLTHGCPNKDARKWQCFFGPHYWSYFLVPGFIFLCERILREYMSRQDCFLLSFTQMGDLVKDKNGKIKLGATKVLSLSFDKVGVFGRISIRAGQYAYLLSPLVSRFEWHPFTISSYPEQDDVTFHIRIIENGWTECLLKKLQSYCKPGELLTELRRPGGKDGEFVPGKDVHIDGKTRLFRVYGPHSAPTQHFNRYQEVFIVTSGIGVTPLNCCMKTVAFHRWKFGFDNPSHVHFYWVTQHGEIQRFRWLIQALKEVCDSIKNISKKQTGKSKSFAFYVFITRGSEKIRDEQRGKLRDYEAAYEQAENETGPNSKETFYRSFWGVKPPKKSNLESDEASFTSNSLYRALCDTVDPKQNDGKPPFWEMKTADQSDVRAKIVVEAGRPKWEKYFKEVNDRALKNNNDCREGLKSNSISEDEKKSLNEKIRPDIGVCFCGNPFIGKALEQNCHNFTKSNQRQNFKLKWHLHQEVF